MKKLTIKRMEVLPSANERYIEVSEYCGYLLTFIASRKEGAIFAKRQHGDSPITWFFTEKTDFIFESPDDAKEILRDERGGMFRPILARLGHNLADEVYFGCGCCDIVFEGEDQAPKRVAIVFSNEKQTGYWIKMQIIRPD